ncbi:hypothetical protein K1T71_013781 [Dendrolimus kikuchii]|uniref:Uncharacterized protein n=1 Tax=Dendrolimus kikuchii TaxID=765133 RepID=A0ACC1CFY1_9NEOP|nr:hypothetical protein K1T71_013781 [Dendrolimus kikuchii]
MVKEKGTDEIEKLQEEKRDLYTKIQHAIDDSVQTLQKSNSTDADIGIKYMEDLKQELQEINSTSEADNKVTNETRRAKRLGINIDEIRNILQGSSRNKNKKYDTKHEEDKNINHIMIKNKMRDWLTQKQLEREKINDYKKKTRERLGFTEKCPRQGIGKKKEKRGKGRKGGRKYPCCRKCCKRSYMGCL